MEVHIAENLQNKFNSGRLIGYKYVQEIEIFCSMFWFAKDTIKIKQSNSGLTFTFKEMSHFQANVVRQPLEENLKDSLFTNEVNHFHANCVMKPLLKFLMKLLDF